MESIINPNLDPEIVFSSRQIADKKMDLGKKTEHESFRASIKRKLRQSFRRDRKGSNSSQR